MSVAVALAAGHLVAGLVSPLASPFLAVGNTAIDLTPHPVKDFAIRTFGENDKLVLLGGMAVVLAGLGVVAGLLSRRSPWPGTAVAALLGLLGIAAVLARPTTSGWSVLAPLASLVAGVAAFRWLWSQAALAVVPERRRFLLSTAAIAVGAGVSALGGQLLAGRVDVEGSRRAIRLQPRETAPEIPFDADFVREGTPEFITPNSKFYRVDTALTVPRLRAEDWRMRVHGMVDNEMVLTYDDLLRRPLVEKTITLVCVSNEVGGPYISTSNFIGVSLPDLLRDAGVRPGADQLATRSVDGWTCGTPVDSIMAPGSNAMLALGMNGEPLPIERGFPVRMVVPGLYGYVSATKWLVDAELTTFDAFDPYWAQRGWGKKAPVKVMSRVDRPKSFERVPAGRFVAAGIAWAQHTGIDRVEVRVDGGLWQEATLSREVNVDTWRMWRVELDLKEGNHTVECRATDRKGYTQTNERAAPIPDGATGWHSMVFTSVA
ncbi:DMSO/TMAO reductase YedYZ molybdopterin-dependent catalytic subunit [Lentzea flaviverrucosa]|uniref:DMSO/TMAO reductase YedYZ, molybdopterin-dependent catalytic subunit n=1 Tax=Lentzea flaviverrucosa TaxID=200379 RepID=A0A1H9XR82_9PSEU|nr:DMSO/TMAO reductase YedYZ molybdopterin-dependent catalytic subunit [Lentzea flaviverrucosa]SES48655.1 DMSO/TMAO reductase YedYZ, molybdopterin-dependent catalytic subunit [Lentzea flaviverrucosa]